MTPLPGSSSKQVDQFLKFLEDKNASIYTIRSYQHHLYIFSSFAAGKNVVQLSEVSLDLILRFKKHLVAKNYSNQTQFSYLMAARSFFKWCQQNKIQTLNYNLVTLPKIENKQKVVVRGTKIDVALSAIDTSQSIGKRDKAIMELLFATGIRVSELVNLNREDIDYDNKRILISGKKNRVVNLSSRALHSVANYLAHRRDTATALFVSSKGKRDDVRMTVRSVQRLVKKYALITPTILRRSFTVDLLEAGESMRNLQKMLGQKHLY